MGILRSSQRLEDSLGSWLPPKVHRGFIGVRYGFGGVGLLPSEQLLLPSRAARLPPVAHPLLSPLFTECLEGRFCELRIDGVLGSSKPLMHLAMPS